MKCQLLASDCTFNSVQFNLSTSLKKYLIDHSYRKRANFFDDDANVDQISKIWDIFRTQSNYSKWTKLSEINFPTNYANGDRISAFDRMMASDLVHFRVGPARLFQFRK